MKRPLPARLDAKQAEEAKARIMHQDVTIGIDVWGERIEFRVTDLAKEQSDAIRVQLLEIVKARS